MVAVVAATRGSYINPLKKTRLLEMTVNTVSHSVTERYHMHFGCRLEPTGIETDNAPSCEHTALRRPSLRPSEDCLY